MEGISMKKSGIIVGFLATAFGLAVVNKMHKMNTNKDSVKGKAKEVAGKVIGNEQMQAEGTFDQVIGASKEVLEDLKQSISGIAGTGTSEKVSGKAKEAVGVTFLFKWQNKLLLNGKYFLKKLLLLLIKQRIVEVLFI